MCGIVGICKRNKLKEKDIENINFISEKLNHRGPNQNLNWTSPKKDILFAHRRLSINDLSQNGIQPMTSHSGRYVIIFNGEIYNFLDLKKNCLSEKYIFRSNSDTEVVLAIIEKYGIFEAINKFNGMFAFAIYDLKSNKIYLARDTLGQKPLYYFKDNNSFFFTSELRDLKIDGYEKKISRQALKFFFQLSYIPAPLTIYDKVYKLEKETILEFKIDSFEFKKYKITPSKNFYNLKDKSFNEKMDIFDETFSQVATDHLISDVNNGALLSGGVDSSLVTFYANKVADKKINSFCVKSINNFYDESKYAENVAKEIGTDHNTLEFSSNDFFHEAVSIHKVYDEPFGDSSQIPTYLLFKSVKKNIKVALSGDGGDEIFFGYNRYLFLIQYYDKLKYLNHGTRVFLSKIINLISENNFDKISNLLNLNYFNFGNKISKIANSLKFHNLEEFYFQIVRQDYNFENIVKTDAANKIDFLDQIKFDKKVSNLKNFQKFDLNTYLTDDIFVKVDRASMFNSVESRAPFVDKRVIDFADQLNISEKIKKNHSKFFLKKILKRHLPNSNFNRPKMGFGNPIGMFLNNELNEWANDLIFKNNELIEKYINVNQIKNIWILHQNKKKDFSNVIWNFLILKNWFLINETN